MPRGPKKHLKRLNAPKHWMLDKLGGVFAPKPSAGPHKTRECLPLCLILRNRLKYALTYKEVTTILMQRLVKVDGKTRVDKCYPAGFMGEYREPPFHRIVRGEKKRRTRWLTVNPIPLPPQTSFPSTRPTSTSASSTMRRAASSCTGSPPPRPR